MQLEEVLQLKDMVLGTIEVHIVIVKEQVPEERIQQEQLNVQTIKVLRLDMGHRIVRHIKGLKAVPQLEEEQVTIQNLKVIHVHRITTLEQNDRLIRERQILERLDIEKLKALLVIIEAQQKVLLAHTDLQDLHHHVHQEQ